MSPSKRIPATPGSQPPAGWILVRGLNSGNLFWADPEGLHDVPRTRTISTLTDSQLVRTERLATVFSEPQNMTKQQWIDNMKRARNPLPEIRLWEHIADVYEAELRSRPKADVEEKEALHSVLVSASMLPVERCTLENIISTCPDAISLPHLQRVFKRYRAKLQSVDSSSSTLRPAPQSAR